MRCLPVDHKGCLVVKVFCITFSKGDTKYLSEEFGRGILKRRDNVFVVVYVVVVCYSICRPFTDNYQRSNGSSCFHQLTCKYVNLIMETSNAKIQLFAFVSASTVIHFELVVSFGVILFAHSC